MDESIVPCCKYTEEPIFRLEEEIEYTSHLQKICVGKSVLYPLCCDSRNTPLQKVTTEEKSLGSVPVTTISQREDVTITLDYSVKSGNDVITP